MKNALLVMPLLAAGLLAAGCASSSSSSVAAGGGTPGTAGSSSASAPSSPAPTSTGTGSGAGSPGAVAASSPANPGAQACTSANLKVSIGGGAGAGMSQDHTGLQFTNVGKTSCTLDGYPGVSWVAGADGHQVGLAATRQKDATGTAERVITLAPGALASAPLDIIDAAVFTPSVCKPVPVRGLRIYPPNETNALFLPLPSGKGGYGECSGTTPQSSLSIGYVQPGAQPTS